MKNKEFNMQMIKFGGVLFLGVMAPAMAHACACGCGVFDVGTSYMLPLGAGGMVWDQYDYQDQNHNWSGMGVASPSANGDKEIETHFETTGAQYMFNRTWGVEAELPYDFRYFRGTLDDGTVASHRWSTLGDLRLQGIYTGFSPDMSTGLTFGLKLPTGGWHTDTALVDRDTQIGTGSTDFLVGGFHRDKIGSAMQWEWFAQAEMNIPMVIQDGYRPGVELDTALGIDYTGLRLGRVQITPIAQVIYSERTSDSGPAADSPATGYERILMSPGLEVNIHPVHIYADVELPVFQNFAGNQLAASILYKFAITYMF